MILLNIVSLSGNMLVCMSVYRNARLRTTTNLYIIVLAFSDLLSAILVMPLAAGVLITGRWPFGETICQVHAFFSLFVVYVSPVTMALTAVNRYTKICKSDQQYNLFFSPCKSRISLACAWTFVTFYILIPRLTGLQDFGFEPGYAACLSKQLSKLGTIVHYSFTVGLFLILPLTLTVFSYRNVLRKIQEHNLVQAQNQDNNMTVSSHEIRITRSLFVVVFAFMMCWIPAWGVAILTRFQVVPANYRLLCSFLLNLSNAINPFIYAGMNPLFRKELRRIISCKSGEEILNTQQALAAMRRPNKISSSPRSGNITNTPQTAASSEDLGCQ